MKILDTKTQFKTINSTYLIYSLIIKNNSNLKVNLRIIIKIIKQKQFVRARKEFQRLKQSLYLRTANKEVSRLGLSTIRQKAK